MVQYNYQTYQLFIKETIAHIIGLFMKKNCQSSNNSFILIKYLGGTACKLMNS